jgi:hypothetical protein
MATYPKDQFDDLPEDLSRVGAHRGPVKRGGGWITFAWAALATGLLVVGGLYAVSLTNTDINIFPKPEAAPVASATPTVIPTAEPLTDPDVIRTLKKDRGITTTIINATATSNLEKTARTALKADKWPVTAVASADATNITETIIYYREAADEDVARGMLLTLGVGDVVQSTAYEGAPITIVLGSDYEAAVAG